MTHTVVAFPIANGWGAAMVCSCGFLVRERSDFHAFGNMENPRRPEVLMQEHISGYQNDQPGDQP